MINFIWTKVPLQVWLEKQILLSSESFTIVLGFHQEYPFRLYVSWLFLMMFSDKYLEYADTLLQWAEKHKQLKYKYEYDWMRD